ncbi:MAG: hypothetical protein QOH66_112 [Actinomycetota bacterium]|nr:hypothetical protein [Actinomycetota bacterium]
MSRRSRRYLACLLIAVGASVPAGVRAVAEPVLAQFSCRAMVLGASATQSGVANSAESPCMDAQTSTSDLPAGLVVLRGGVASTHQSSASGASALKEGDQATATVNVAGVDIPALGLSIAGIRAEASTTCQGGQPVLAGSSSVGEVRVAGTPVRLLDGHLDLPLGLATLHLNETIHDGGRIIQRAVWLQGPQGDVIVGEATTGATGPVCGSATITIVSRRTASFGQPFQFTGDLGTFSLPEQGNSTLSAQRAFAVVPGRYSVMQSLSPNQAAGWLLQDLTCTQDSASSIDPSSGTVTVVVKAGESLTCTFTNEPRVPVTGGAAPPKTGAAPPKTVYVLPSFNAAAPIVKPRTDTNPSTQSSPAPSVAPTMTPGTEGGAGPSPSGLVGKALPATSGESSAGGFSPIWLLLVLGILALFFLLFFLWRRKKEREQEPSP